MFPHHSSKMAMKVRLPSSPPFTVVSYVYNIVLTSNKINVGVVAMYGINPGFLEFLIKLENKKEGEPLIHWQSGIDFLTVFIGDGDCRQYTVGGFVYPHVSLLRKRYPAKGEDDFAGFEISGGIKGFLRYHYKKILGDDFAEFALRHNAMTHEYHASELLEMWLGPYPQYFSRGIKRIKRALTYQNPSLHIPF